MTDHSPQAPRTASWQAVRGAAPCEACSARASQTRGTAPAAVAAPSTGAYGSPENITDGAVTASYAVWRPQVSNDTVNVPVVGKLYEAKTTVKAVQGVVTPSIPFFNARTGSGDNYRVLWQAYAPEGLDAATLQQGETATGKIYFDVTGAAPTTVVYNDAVQDRASWGGSGGGGGYGGGEAARGAAPSSAGDYHNNPCYPGCL